jgi:hypothetical protein
MKWIGLLLPAALAACVSTRSPTVLVHTDSSPVAPFATYRTFGFGLAGALPAPFQESARSFAVERRMRSLVVAELVRKGYAEEQAGPANPDFVVTVASGYAAEAFSMGEAPLFETAELGAIVIDVFDASSAAHVWHSTGEAEVDPRTINDQLLQASVHGVLASFPARVKRERGMAAQ